MKEVNLKCPNCGNERFLISTDRICSFERYGIGQFISKNDETSEHIIADSLTVVRCVSCAKIWHLAELKEKVSK